MYGIGYWLSKHAQLHPDRVAVVTADRRITYHELNRDANRVAHALRRQGISEGQRVGILSVNHPEFLAVLFGAGKVGVTVVPLNYRLSVPELVYQIQDSAMRVLFVGAEQAELVPELGEETALEQYYVIGGRSDPGSKAIAFGNLVVDQPDDDPAEPLPWDRPLLIVYTSGTTGRPKGAVLTHANQFWNAMNDIIPLRLTADDITLSILPLVHVGGIGLFTLPTLLLGGRVVLPRQFEPDTALRLIEAEGVTVVMGVPTVFQMLLRSELMNEVDLSSVRVFYNGGDRCPLEVVDAFRQRGLPFGGGYGLTETSPTAYMLEPEDFERGTQRLGFIGQPAFFTRTRIVDPASGEDVPSGDVGEIWLRGPNVFSGYWNQPEASEDSFSDGWFCTGDLATHDEEGFTYIVGRSKEMYKSGGLNVYPAEVEAVVGEHPAVREVCVIGVPDPKWGEVGRAVVAPHSGADVSAEELLEWSADRLARYKIPKSVTFVPALPRNQLGKVVRVEVEEQFGETSEE